MRVDDFVLGFERKTLGESVLYPLKKITELSRNFHREAGLPLPTKSITQNTLVVESCQEPDFLPPSEAFRKAFMADRLSLGIKDSIALFGFADYSVSAFDGKKPSYRDFNDDLMKLKARYGEDFSIVEDLFLDCSKRAKNFADLNFFLYSRICSEILGLQNVFFFRCSDVQKEGLFLLEYMGILSNLSRYNEVYNKFVSEKNVLGLNRVEPGMTPLSLCCSCKHMVKLRLAGEVLSGACQNCGKNHGFIVGNLLYFLPEIIPDPVSRDVIYSEGLRSSVYVSDSQGNPRRAVSSGLINSLGYNQPKTILWESRASLEASFIDELMSIGSKGILDSWNAFFSGASFEVSDGMYTAKTESVNKSIA